MDEIDVSFCFYDDADYATDADRDSRLLRSWHSALWSKPLPTGGELRWSPEPGSMCLVDQGFRVSSDTIATTHLGYVRRGVPSLPADEREAYERAFYTIGGFIIFPVRPQSLNQRRGTSPAVADRFDYTLECIRRHYVGIGSPLADVLQADSAFFGLFGVAREGFEGYLEFFHLQDLASPDAVRWFGGAHAPEWDVSANPLPTDLGSYRRYLDAEQEFVAARNDRIRVWCEDQRT